MGIQKQEEKTNRDFAIGLDARMISHSGIGMRIRGLLKYLGPISKKEKIQIYLFGDLKTIQNEGISCHEFFGFEQNQNPITTKHKSIRNIKDFSYPVISYHTQIYSFSEFLGHPWMNQMDILDIPHFNAPLTHLHKSIVTIHDIIPFRMKEFHSSFVKRIYMQVVFRLIRSFSKKIVSVSKYTAMDLESVFGFSKDKIKLIYNGIDHTIFYPATSMEKKNFLKKYNLKEGYLLSVGIGKGHKNLNLVLDVLKSLWDSKVLKTKWVLGGTSGKIPDYLQSYIVGYEDQIVPMKRLTLEELRCLYSCAGLFIFPSKYEGFGFPPLEAQACGCPVISSNSTVMPEILQNSVFYFSPENPSELENLLKNFLKNHNSVKKLIPQGKKNSGKFSWKKAASETLEVYKNLL
ncbi:MULTISPECIES: glycosyltransferase family 4 protein [Leptospira]|uniref:Glycosyl transferase n=1 Tax=Leptospira kirschneri serovar Pomona TaxID=561005 RepID=A0A1T1E2G3_9LEPT|nr:MULTISPECIES: glycosyltransferase family 1 protein [Leptospira]EMK10738.1 glycosyltransferase, group 1 family protein [Leptospira kirschneri]KXZ28369.1 glycosyl transferase [Leptospira kirschneri]KXZ31140.1 glycosyl transferase [Leptospira sp. ZV016]OOV47277.1 glycosyl transferase [Leptospira kirschneri serovar Pomona]